MAKKWYVIRTYSGHENKVKANIDRMVKARKLEDLVGQVNVPTIKVAEMTTSGKKRVVKKKFMPGYILAELDLDDQIRYLINGLPSVSGFIGSPDPESLSASEVRNLMEESEAAETEEVSKAHNLFQVGESVKIVDGPFANFTGIVDEILPDKGRLRVKVEIFGQATPVELDFLQVASNVG